MGGIEITPLEDRELIEASVEVIKRYLPHARVIVFGSRAKGRHRPNSDLDLALDIGKPIEGWLMETLREELDKLPTLVSFDLVDLHKVGEDFKKTILSEGKVVYDGRPQKGSGKI